MANTSEGADPPAAVSTFKLSDKGELTGINELVLMSANKLKTHTKDEIVKFFCTLQTFIKSSGVLTQKTQTVGAPPDLVRLLALQIEKCDLLHEQILSASLDAGQYKMKCEHLQKEIDHNIAKGLEENTLTERVANLEKGNTKGANADVDALITEVVKELDERQSKERNVVIYGLTEDNVDAAEVGRDENVSVSALFAGTMRCGNVRPEKSFRLGRVREEGSKPRPIKVFLPTAEDKRRVLDSVPFLKALPVDHEHRRVYVRSDLTTSQRAVLQTNRVDSDVPAALHPDNFPRLGSSVARGLAVRRGFRGVGRGAWAFGRGAGGPGVSTGRTAPRRTSGDLQSSGDLQGSGWEEEPSAVFNE